VRRVLSLFSQALVASGRKRFTGGSILLRADEAIEWRDYCCIALGRDWASRHLATAQRFGRFRSETDLKRRSQSRIYAYSLSERRRPRRARPRPQYPARLPRCHDEQTRKPQQHAAVVLPRIGARDARGIVGDEVAAHVVVKR